MSSAAYIVPNMTVTREQWNAWCRDAGITYSPATVGGNVYYADDVEIFFGPTDREAEAKGPMVGTGEIRFGTYYMGNLRGVAHQAVLAWAKFGGTLTADPEVRGAIAMALGHRS